MTSYYLMIVLSLIGALIRVFEDFNNPFTHDKEFYHPARWIIITFFMSELVIIYNLLVLLEESFYISLLFFIINTIALIVFIIKKKRLQRAENYYLNLLNGGEW